MEPRWIDRLARALGGRATRRGVVAGAAAGLVVAAEGRDGASARGRSRCDRPRVRCGSTCCSKGSACAGKTCCKVRQGASVCYDPAADTDVCCSPDEECTNDGCCATGEGRVSCGGRCCPAGSVCTYAGCCPVDDGAVVCDGACCPAGSECSDDGCCPVNEGRVVCGGTCCAIGSACAGDTCCPVASGSVVCGQACCQPDPWRCSNGTCVNRCDAAPAPGNDYSGCTLSGDFSFTNLTGANFDQAQIRSRFAGATLVGASFREITGGGIEFPKAVLDEADFTRAKPAWFNMDDASARRAILVGADLSGSRLVRTDLSGAWLMDADLDESYMFATDLSRANLSGASLRGVDLVAQSKMLGAILIGATLFRSRVDPGILDEAILCNTTMPDGTVNNRDC